MGGQLEATHFGRWSGVGPRQHQSNIPFPTSLRPSREACQPTYPSPPLPTMNSTGYFNNTQDLDRIFTLPYSLNCVE